VNQGGDYVMVAKDNQPTLRADIALLFATPGNATATMTRTCSTERAHDRLERRTLQTSTTLTSYLDWPGLAQVFRIERRIVDTCTGEVSKEVVYGLTSLAAARADAKAVLRLLRDHWTIENRCHWVRDVPGRDLRRGPLSRPHRCHPPGQGGPT